jgi:hypothetical protein
MSFCFAYSAAGSSAQYLSGLSQMNASMTHQLADHHVKLSNLRALSHTLRTSFLPDLESELIALQRELQAKGCYDGPVHARKQPQLIPPTPFRANAAHTSLAIPQTPAQQLHHARANITYTPNQAGPRARKQ